MRKLVLTIFWSSLLLTAASFGGALHGLGDSLAVFRHIWAVALAISSLLLLRGHLRLAGLGVGAVVLLAAPLANGLVRDAGAGTGRYTLYQKNLRYDGKDRQAIIDDILAANPDFVTLQEISFANREILRALAERYPSSLLCEFENVGSVAILSRFALVEGSQTCVQEGPAAIKVTTPDGPVWAVALHLLWPFPFDQRGQVNQIVRNLGFLDAPVVLGGDFNMVAWSDTMRRIEAATGSRHAGKAIFTFRLNEAPFFRLPIDHVLVPSGRGRLERRPLAGSDHYGILLSFDL